MEFEQLLRKYFDGAMTEAELERFQTLLENVPEYRTELRQSLEVRSLLHDDALNLKPPTDLSEHIRIAVGASPRDVTLQLVRRILPFALLGSAAGVVGGAGLGRVLGALLHGVSPADPVSLALAAFTLAATGVASAWRPIRQAVRADPATALRAEG